MRPASGLSLVRREDSKRADSLAGHSYRTSKRWLDTVLRVTPGGSVWPGLLSVFAGASDAVTEVFTAAEPRWAGDFGHTLKMRTSTAFSIFFATEDRAMNGIRRILLPLFLAALVGAITPLTALAATQPRLGTATSFAVLAGAGITNTGATTITGDVGTFPTATETGFGPGANAVTILSGANHHGDAVTQGAKTDLVTAYTDAANQTPCTTLTTLTGQNLTPGTYCFSSSAGLTGPLTLSGFGVYIFKIGSSLTTASGSSVLLRNNAQACGVWWQVTSAATFGTGSSFQGTVMALTDITMNTGATLIGRALARNGAVTTDTNTITRPAALCSGLPITGSPVSTPKPPTTGVGPAPAAGVSLAVLAGSLGLILIVAGFGYVATRRRREE